MSHMWISPGPFGEPLMGWGRRESGMKCCEELCGVEGIDPGSWPSSFSNNLTALAESCARGNRFLYFNSNTGQDSLHKLILGPL